jgi:cytochrome c-type biogenesis protein CcmE
MDPSTKRALLIGGAALAGGVGVFFALNAFEENLMFYLTPTQVLQSEVPIAPTKKFRLGGMVKNGSISHDRRSLRITFLVTDYSSDGNEIRVEFEGMLPDLFREGQGVVAEGFYDRNTGIFRATEVLAKHDENYMPKEIKEQLQKQKLDDVVIGKS